MHSRRVFLSILILAGLMTASAMPAQDAKKTRILFVTQSKGFQHGSVKRPADKLSPPKSP